MVNVAFFVVFAMGLFSIVGVQSFKGSFQRTCVWIDPTGQDNYTLSNQHCGGHINSTTGIVSMYIPRNEDRPISNTAKGFICPLGQLCLVSVAKIMFPDCLLSRLQEGPNPYNNTESFDNVAASLQQVVVITSCR